MLGLEASDLEKLHYSELVYLKIKPIHFPSPNRPIPGPKINLENQNTFWPTTLQRKRKGEHQNAPKHTHTHNLRNRQRGFPFSGAGEAARRKNILMRVCPSMFLRWSFKCMLRLFSHRQPQLNTQKILQVVVRKAPSGLSWRACCVDISFCVHERNNKSIDKAYEHAWVFDDYVPFAYEYVVCAWMHNNAVTAV